jgi:hypothetical protein
MCIRRVALAGLCGLLAAPVAFAGSKSVAVAPGDPSTLVPVADPCPTFSWGEVEGATSYELVIYSFGEEGEEAQPVLRQSFAGSVYGWTPSLEACLEQGGRYAWAVRATRPSSAGEWEAASSDVFWWAIAGSGAELGAAPKKWRTMT